MKRLLSAAILLMIAGGLAIGQERRVLIPVNVSLFPVFGLSDSVTVVNNVQINAGVGYSDELHGVAVGVVNIVGNEVRGAQTGVVNLVGGDVRGAQIGVVNLTRREVFGPQIGVVNGSLKAVHGPQVGVVNLAAESPFQTGVVNSAVDASGVQVGVVNVAVRNTGAPIGLVSVVLKGGQTHVQSWIDETGLVSVGLIHGSQTTYNIYTVATDAELEQVSLGMGLGVRFGGNRSWTNIEVTGASVSRTDALFQSASSVYRVRAYAGYKIGPVAVIGGVSFNYLMSPGRSGVQLGPLHGYEFDFSSDRHRFWPGAFVGIRL